MARKQVSEKQVESSTRAAFERNLSTEFFETLDHDATMVEELFFHRIRMSEAFIDRINNDPAFARVERECRQMFVESSLSLLECNPTDAAKIAEAQVNVLAATKIMAIFSQAVTDGQEAKKERIANQQTED